MKLSSLSQLWLGIHGIGNIAIVKKSEVSFIEITPAYLMIAVKDIDGGNMRMRNPFLKRDAQTLAHMLRENFGYSTTAEALEPYLFEDFPKES